MKKNLTFLISFFTLFFLNAQTTLVAWTFEGVTAASTAASILSITTGSAVADVGVATSGSAVSAFHTSASTVYSNPAGNGSLKSLSSNNWGVGDYYQFKLTTTGYKGIKLAWDQTGSNTGPAPFKVQYSTTAGGASGYTDFMSYTVPNNPASTPTAGASYSWSTTTPIISTSFTANLNAITALDNKSEVYFRLVCTATTAVGATSTFAVTGTGRVDNFAVTADLVIPVELVAFKAQKENSSTKLSWQTASESNNSHYNIERSANGKTFDKIGEVTGNGTTQLARNYTFMDEKPSNSINYYRLRQVDFDGKETVSKAVSVDFSGKSTARIYPSIATDKINVELNADGNAVDLIVLNLLGQVVKAQNLAHTEGVISLNIGDLPKGFYMIRLNSKSDETTQKFEKQ